VKLTSTGQELFDVSGRLIRELGEVVSRIKHERNFLTVRTTSSFASLWLLPRIDGFYEEASSVDLEIITGESSEIKSRERLNEISIRFGNVTDLDPGFLIAKERYNLFCSPDYLASHKDPLKCFTIFLNRWKNSALPVLPIKQWKQRNNIDDHLVTEVNFDQEIFGVQQAIAGKGMVFASHTLCSHLLSTGLLVESSFNAIDSELGFYFNEGPEDKSWTAGQFFRWINLINQSG